MTREEQIEQAAKSFAKEIDCWELAEDVQDAFEQGAEWADTHPADETVKSIVTFYKLWYTTESSEGMVEYIKNHMKSCN